MTEEEFKAFLTKVEARNSSARIKERGFFIGLIAILLTAFTVYSTITASLPSKTEMEVMEADLEDTKVLLLETIKTVNTNSVQISQLIGYLDAKKEKEE